MRLRCRCLIDRYRSGEKLVNEWDGTAPSESWCIGAVTMTMETALCWNVSVSKVFPTRSCAAGFGPLSCQWTINCTPPCFRRPLSDSGGAGSASGFLPRPNTTHCTVPTVPQTGPNGARGIGRGKRGLVCRKSTPGKAAYIKAFGTALNGGLYVYIPNP